MDVKVTYRPGLGAAGHLLRLPKSVVGDVTIVRGPLGWTEREIASYVIQRTGPHLLSIESMPAAPALGCNCMGRRNQT